VVETRKPAFQSICIKFVENSVNGLKNALTNFDYRLRTTWEIFLFTVFHQCISEFHQKLKYYTKSLNIKLAGGSGTTIFRVARTLY